MAYAGTYGVALYGTGTDGGLVILGADVRGLTATVSGWAAEGSTVVVSCATGSPGPVVFVSDTGWTCAVTIAEGSNTITASDGTASDSIAVTGTVGAVVANPPVASLALSAAAPTVSTPTWRVDAVPPSVALSLATDAPTVGLLDASPLSLPAWVWNGTEYVRASFHILG